METRPLSDLIAALRNGDPLMQEAADALMANQGAIVNSIIERTRHTPTDNEREAPIAEVAEAFRQHEGAPTWQDDPVGRDAALRWHMRGYKDGLAGFRRSEVPEPSTECPKCGVRATGQTPSTFYTHHDETCDGALEEPQGEPSDALTIPRPHVPFGPHGIPEREADAVYLDHAASNLEGNFEVGGSNVRATVVKLLRDTAAALSAAWGAR